MDDDMSDQQFREKYGIVPDEPCMKCHKPIRVSTIVTVGVIVAVVRDGLPYHGLCDPERTTTQEARTP